MAEEESKCAFCGRKIGLDDSFVGDDEGRIFGDQVCLLRFEMGDKDKCVNCNKKIFGYVLKAKDNANREKFYFCSEVCFEKYNNKRTKNKLERVSSAFGGIWNS